MIMRYELSDSAWDVVADQRRPARGPNEVAMGALLGERKASQLDQCAGRNGDEGKFFQTLWPVGRALARVNGWFEWIPDPGDPKRKQPYYITATSNEPLFFAALAEVHVGLEPDGHVGLVIITAVADEGMVDIHDPKPIVLRPDLARE